jgi:hypothetical protein
MLKTICLKDSVFHGYNIVVDMELISSLDYLYMYIRNRIVALCILHNFNELKAMAERLRMRPDVFGTLEEVMLSNERVIYLQCSYDDNE